MALQIRCIDTSRDDVPALLGALREKLSPRGDVVSTAGRQRTLEVFGQPLTPQQVVQRICGDVRREGIEALLRYGEKLDRARLTPQTLRVGADELAAAHRAAAPEFLNTIRRIRGNIQEYAQAILHRDVTVTRPGVVLRQRYLPLARVGLCIPGGAAAYPSTVLMTAVPAQVAGVAQIAIVAPPTPYGANHPDVLATCHELGISEVYRAGGAQAVAALAYGVEGLPAVDKIAGPGNLFVTLAKRYVFGEVDIDSLAGPSEVVVIADDSSHPDFVASDLLAQAEHAPGASLLVTWSRDVLEATVQQLERQVTRLARCELTIESLESFAALILVSDEDEACRIANLIAPEHLHVAMENAQRLLPRLTAAGAIFLGPFSPVAVGDYAAGPSHVLPTSGTARWASGLTANSFLRTHSVITYDHSALTAIAPDVQLMADKEGLTAHRASVDMRLEA
jgi:histidinol dehydrogenase